jgi:fatty acid desaturase/membrane-associated phospholipid phosphatase
MSLAREKLVLFLVLGVLAGVVYFGTLYASVFPAATVPVTALDDMIPLVPAFVVPYCSFFLLILVPLFVIKDRGELRDTAFGFGLIVVLAGIAFLFWPTRIGNTGTHPLVDAILSVDRNRNACPSLHAALALYCALVARRRLVWIWTLPVIVSPLLIHRHNAIDIAAGAVLGWAVYAVIFRPERVEAPDSEPVLETVRIRKCLAQQSPEAFAMLTRLEGRKRAAELMVFPALAAAGFVAGIQARHFGSVPLEVAAIAITATALNTFPLLLHEGMHGLLFASRRWNWIVSVLLGATFLMSFSAYRVLHLRHHRYLGDPRDPDDYHNYSLSRQMVWVLHFVRLACGSLLYVFLIPLLAVTHGSTAQRKLVLVEYTMLFTIYSVVLRVFPARELLLVWFVPLLLVGTLTAIRGFTQHGITRASDPYLASRTMLPNPVVAFFLLNENYHLEHHLFPEVPSYHLPELHKLIWPKLPRAVSGRSYLAFLGSFLRATPRMDETPIGLVAPDEQRP